MAKGATIPTGTDGKAEEVKKTPETGIGKEPKAKQESVYTARELADNARELFGTRPECVTAALKAANKESCTVSEAKEIVGKFMKREVE